MLLRTTFVLSLLLFLTYSRLVVSQHETLRLLTIGDSTDRCNLQDFCAKFNGHLCNTENCTISTIPHEKLISEFLNIYPKLHDKGSTVSYNSWAIEFCELSEPKMRIGFLFERTGVQPYCPWHWGQGVYSEKYCAATRDAMKTKITMNDTFPALYGPIMLKMFKALGGPPHVITMQSHLWDVTLMFHRRMNAQICDSPQRRQPFIESWSNNASDYIQVVRDMVGPKPFMVWRTGNRRPCPPEERCKNSIMDEMNKKSEIFTKALNIHRVPYSNVLNPPCRDSIHPKPEITLNYMDRLLKVIAANVPEVSKTLAKFNHEAAVHRNVE